MENLNISDNESEIFSTSAKADASNLSEIFDNGLARFASILETKEATNSIKIQADVKCAMSIMEDATRLVSIADIFSNNESLDEVPTENLKYFMLPVILGTLATKVCNVDDRMHLVHVAKVYFTDFLERAKAYGITDHEIPEEQSTELVPSSEGRAISNAEKITKMVNTRESKLQRYRERKELEARFGALKKSKDNPNVDDETLREYYITWLKCYVNVAIEELDALESERQVIQYMKTLPTSQSRNGEGIHKFKVPISKLEPIIITRDAVQKQVFGAGYPSLPVLTVEEFYEQRVKDGDWPDSSQRNQVCGKPLQSTTNPVDDYPEEDREDIETENQAECDDPESRARTFAMDEYKDTHRRGWGNRANRS